MWFSTVGLIIALAVSFLVVPRATDAQQPVKLIGVLGGGPAPSEAQRHQLPFWHTLHELGWQEGHNIAFAGRYAAGQLDRLPDLAAELVRLKPAVIVTAGTLGARAAQQATTTIPIVLTGAGMLVEQGLVASLAHPGGNITGVENNALGLSGKRLEVLKAAVPQLARVVFLFDPATAFLVLPSMETDARALGLQLQPVAVRQADAFDAVLATIVAQRPDALFINDDALLNLHRQQIIDFATTHQIPTLGGQRQFVEAGGLMAFGSSPRDLAQRAAVYVDKILKGAKPGDLPIERPMTFELVINLKTAQALGLTFPPTILFQANEVIK